MTIHRNDTHAMQANAWADKNARGLSSDQLVQLFSKAIRAIEQRSLVTLSSVTVMVVIDRALHESNEKFPLLSEIKIAAEGMDFSDLLEKSDNHKSELLREALLCLLVALLNVLGNITADILTHPLHKVLMEVTGESAPVTSEQRSLRAVNSTKKNREKA